MGNNRTRFAEMDQQVAAAVRAELARTNTTRKALSERTGLHINIINRKCRGDVPFTPEELSAVAAALDVTSSYLTAEAEKHFHLAAQEQS